MPTACGLLHGFGTSGRRVSGTGSLEGMFVGLVEDPGAGWELPDEFNPQPRRRRLSMSAMPWRALVSLAAVVLLFTLSRWVGSLAGYVLLLVAVAAGSLWLDRQLGPVARGMRDYQS